MSNHKKPAADNTIIPGNHPAEKTVRNHEEKVTPLEKTDGMSKDPEQARKNAEDAKVKAGVAEQVAKIATLGAPDAAAVAQRIRGDAPSPVPQPTSNPSGQQQPQTTVQYIEQRRAPIVPTASIAPAPHVVSQGLTVDDPPQGIHTTSGPIGEDQRGRGTTIQPNDPQGRQPGDPNSVIELPPGVSPVNPVARLGATVVGDYPMSASDLEREEERMRNMSPIQRVGGISLPVSENVAVGVLGGVVGGTSAGFEPVADGLSQNAAASPTITPQTQMEIEAGRAAVANRHADIEHNRRLSREDAAKRTREGAPADAGDLGYRKE